MSPADGSDKALWDATRVVPQTQAIVLAGGRVLLIFQGAVRPLPRSGLLIRGAEEAPWTAECWSVAGAEGETWCGLALLPSLPLAELCVWDAADGCEWRLAPPARIDVAPQPLVDLVRGAGVDSRAVFGFLARHLLAGSSGRAAEAQAHRSFARGFLTLAAERDGFIEILATPDGGGLFAQGWSLSLGAGATTVASVTDDLAMREVEVALFERPDILPPGRGFCFFAIGWRDEDAGAVDAVFFECRGRLLRLDVLPGAVRQLERDATIPHVVAMLPRLEAPTPTLRAFKRVCRPRFHGEDTLTGTALPVAAAFDALLQAPDGALLATGWLLDPLHRVERVLVKSTGNLYAHLDVTWCEMPRPDLNRAFATDPRFTGGLDPHETMHGFIAHAPARLDQTRGAETYLELVLDDETCLFQPLNVTPFTAERLPQLLSAISATGPELERIVEDQLSPFLASVRPRARAPRRGMPRPMPLGVREAEPREVAAIMPFERFASLQPVLGLLAGTPDAERMDLTLVAPRSAAEGLERLDEALRFYGLRGSLIIASEQETLAGRLDLGVAATSGERLLCWHPQALPRGPGWLATLIAEADALPVPGLISPALVYEDGSICFGGAEASTSAGGCAHAGYGEVWLGRGAPRPVASAAAAVALVPRELLARAGGFAGQLFGDAYAHVDLAERLRATGGASHCSGAVSFWMLDDPAEAGSAMNKLMSRIDAALLARRGRHFPGVPA